ncbi:hypothetical protein BT63DRAFT_270088 [Microthyrium microscopicum]|uniref:Bromo domain-containing protein n=1 Tax=Microthyrium microscopicum TaxID=703497 RepID=A0A6A6U895_9PEZI|nr:hypothetical protein BT63DRAFT_270088 [Microthyrium microscopicum]
MPGPTAYTRLEALLLFQYLRAYGISPTVFNKVSENLKDDPQIRDTNGYDPGRLSPDALREFFLRIWKDEVRKEEKVSGDSDIQNGAPNNSPRKRKAPSPSLPTIQDAQKNLELLPKVILKLYNNYREDAVREIQEAEEKYDKLQQELVEIRRGDWDTKLQTSLEQRRQAQVPTRPNGTPRANMPTASKSMGSYLRPVIERRDQATRSPSPSSTTIELPKTVPRQLLSAQQASTPLAAPNRMSMSSPGHSQTAIAPSPYRANPTSTPQAVYGQRLSIDRPASPLNPQSPVHLPQGQATTPLAQSHQPPARNTPSAPLATIPNQQHSPAPSSIAGTPPPYPPSGRPVGAPQYGASPHPSQRGGVMLQPFQVSPQVPTPLQQQQSTGLPPVASQPRTLPRMVTTNPESITTPLSGKPRPGPTPLVLSISRMLSNPALSRNNTPVQSPTSGKRRAETIWTDASMHAPTSSPERPRSISPISEHAASPEPEEQSPKRRGAGRKSKGPSKETSLTEPTAPSTRSNRVSTRNMRGISTASSAIDSSARGRTRSESAASHMSTDQLPKPEPSTPNEQMDVSMGEDTPMPAPNAVSRRSTRNKRKRSVDVDATSESGYQGEGTAEPAEVQYPQPIERDSVFVVRNFPRLSNTVMNDIVSHKHASLFSHPVRDRDAEGYSTMIRRPTDLKTIKAAIGAGARAVNAANVPADASSTGSMLPWSEDLIPPKAIVNSAQLESEIMRMFANAVMFNPGEDSVVADAREMFESAEASLVNFRSAEKTAEASTAARKRAESEMSPSQEDDAKESSVTAGTGKRRRVA